MLLPFASFKDGILSLLVRKASFSSVQAKFAEIYCGSILFFEDEVNIMTTIPKIPSIARAITPNLFVQNAASVNVMV